MKCYNDCMESNVSCKEKSCRLWIDFPGNLNCTEIAVQREGKMTLFETGKRLKVTPSRVKQIESKALSKLISRLPIER